MQPQLVTAVIIAALGPWIVAHNILTEDQWSGFVNASVTYVFNFGIPIAMAVYAWVKTKRRNLIIATSDLPGVHHVGMDTQAGADEINDTEIPDKVYSPIEVRRSVANQAGVKEVVMKTAAGALDSDHPKIVGPGK